MDRWNLTRPYKVVCQLMAFLYVLVDYEFSGRALWSRLAKSKYTFNYLCSKYLR